MLHELEILYRSFHSHFDSLVTKKKKKWLPFLVGSSTAIRKAPSETPLEKRARSGERFSTERRRPSDRFGTSRQQIWTASWKVN